MHRCTSMRAWVPWVCTHASAECLGNVVHATQEIKAGDRARVRGLFERATHTALAPKRMKFLFRRYLDYEKAHGDAAGVEHVKQAAREYVEANLSDA